MDEPENPSSELDDTVALAVTDTTLALAAADDNALAPVVNEAVAACEADAAALPLAVGAAELEALAPLDSVAVAV